MIQENNNEPLSPPEIDSGVNFNGEKYDIEDPNPMPAEHLNDSDDIEYAKKAATNAYETGVTFLSDITNLSYGLLTCSIIVLISSSFEAHQKEAFASLGIVLAILAILLKVNRKDIFIIMFHC